MAPAARPDAVPAVLSSGTDLSALAVSASRLLAGIEDPVIAHLPAASLDNAFIPEPRAALAEVAAVEVVGQDGHWLPDALDQAAIRSASLLYLPGGNTYALRHRLHTSGLWEVVRERVLAGMPLLTVSAGTVLCGTSILSSNDWNVVATTHFDGLGLLPLHLNVHYAPASPTAVGETREERIGQLLHLRRRPVLALEEGCRLLVDAGVVTVEGGCAWLFTEAFRPARRLEAGQQLGG